MTIAARNTVRAAAAERFAGPGQRGHAGKAGRGPRRLASPQQRGAALCEREELLPAHSFRRQLYLSFSLSLSLAQVTDKQQLTGSDADSDGGRLHSDKATDANIGAVYTLTHEADGSRTLAWSDVAYAPAIGA